MRVYIASPFFNEEQLERVEFIEKTLEKYNIEYFSPRRDTYVKPDSNNEERNVAFTENIKGILNCSFIIVVTDGKDVGTIFEAGVAYNEDISIVYFAETLGDKPFNLMLAMSGDIICKSRYELDNVLKIISKDGINAIAQLKANDKCFEGVIE
jgi:nucleoside 2-deoxyribosyltransferase